MTISKSVVVSMIVSLEIARHFGPANLTGEYAAGKIAARRIHMAMLEPCGKFRNLLLLRIQLYHVWIELSLKKHSAMGSF
jgi:hypothetical protein